jgi:hypothetical protein
MLVCFCTCRSLRLNLLLVPKLRLRGALLSRHLYTFMVWCIDTLRHHSKIPSIHVLFANLRKATLDVSHVGLRIVTLRGFPEVE